MVNNFGQSSKRGPPGPSGDQGPPGKKGKDALGVTKWFSYQSLEGWRNVSDATFYFDYKDSGFTHEDRKITVLKSHSKTWHFDAISEGEIGELKKIQRGYSLEFKNSLFFINETSLARAVHTTSCLTISFFVSKAPSEKEYLISTINNRAVSIQGERI